MRRLFAAFACAGVMLLAVDASGQHPLHRLGLGQTMDGALPFEQVDPLSGNLVVTV